MTADNIREKIYRIRDHEVMLDSDLAGLYGVETRQVNQAVSRNKDRFPEDFVFGLTSEEFSVLRSQNVTSSWGGRRHPPKAFSEQGVYMLTTVLKSQKASEVTIAIMRTFTKLRKYAMEHSELSAQIHGLRQEIKESKVWTKDKLMAVADAIIMLEDSLSSLKEMVLEIKSTSEVEKIGFLRN